MIKEPKGCFMKRIRINMIAPCGMNCAVCSAVRREEKNIVKCPGCRGSNKNKPETCVHCIIINCKRLKSLRTKYCSDQCEEFPCKRLKALDKRYRKQYDFSMLDNLEHIAQKGIRAFARAQERKYVKKNRIFCIHNRKYYSVQGE